MIVVVLWDDWYGFCGGKGRYDAVWLAGLLHLLVKLLKVGGCVGVELVTKFEVFVFNFLIHFCA